ncbi:MAG: ABC transporter ATP-binding protein [Lachnospiraceae bacterium]
MIEINHLTKKYGNHVAVDDLSLNIESGKIYGFLGPNGAGKSTTMNIITGYLGATSGEVKINGFDIFTNPEEAKKCIGYLPEIPPLYLDMTVGEYLKFVAELKKIKKSERKKNIAEAMELTKITDMEHRLIKNLSKGYKQRVGLAQAVLGYPEVIILDEPTVGLDPKQIIEIRDLIKTLGKRHTVILSSHILSEISAVCDHVFIIAKGKLVASDTAEHLTSTIAGAQELSLLVKGAQTDVRATLHTVENVDDFDIKPAEEDGQVKVLVRSKKDADIREAVFLAFAKKNLPLLEMITVTKSLEDVFLKVTGQSTPDLAQQVKARLTEPLSSSEPNPISPENAAQAQETAGQTKTAEKGDVQ